MSEECVFCRIVRGAQPASIVWQDELTMAFTDLPRPVPVVPSTACGGR